MKTTKHLLMTALIVTTVVLTGCNNKPTPTENDNAESAVLNNIATRVSVRSYLDKPVEEAKIEQMLRAGMAAPSAVNKQPWHFIVVTEKAQLEALAQASPNAGMMAKAPLAIVVCGDMDKALEGGGRDFWIQDCSAATENILLAAHSLGLGAVWTGAYPSPERCETISVVVGLPETLIPLNIIVIGYPDSTNEPKDKWKPENISYNRYNAAD